MSHELPFKFSQKILDLLPNRNFGHVFFTMCGSTAVDTSLKIALAYHKSKGNASKIRFIGRERGYHGVGFGGK
jgi:beta-alanine--pyruvate transaminase